nr:hypothetical protein [Bacteriovoracaceae bacterium]
MKNKILSLLFFQSVFTTLCYAECTKKDIEAWVSKNMKTTKHSFKSYHWGSRSFFSPEELLELKVKNYPFWQEIFYYFPSAKSQKEEIPSYEIKLATNESQGLKYFQTMADNYFWNYESGHSLKGSKPEVQDWDIGMGFYGAID